MCCREEKMQKMQNIFCERASSSLRYGHDTSTARCRIPFHIIQLYQLSINIIIHIKITVHNTIFSVLCIVFPYQNYDENISNNIIIDDSVVKGSRIQWTSGSCEVTDLNC